MPGLFGVLCKAPDLDERELRAMGLRMAASMRSRPWLRAEMWVGPQFCGGRVHIGVHNPRPQPQASRDGACQSWFHGQAYPPGAAHGVTPDADAIVDALATGGRGLAQLDGAYAIACYSPATHTLALATDRLGSRPLYWAESDRWFAYAGEAKALLAIMDGLPDLDAIAAMQFLSFDHMLGERTWWKGIELMPPGSVWHVSRDALARHRYWDFGHIRREPCHDQASVRAEFGRVFTRLVRQRKRPGPMPLLLSGGLDSRFLLAELTSQGAELTAVTFGSALCSDMRLASRCARIAGVPHRKVLITQEDWWHHRDEAIWQTDGLVNAIHLHVAVALDELHRGSLHTLKNNSAGTLFGGARLRRFTVDWHGDPSELLSNMYCPNPLVSAGEVIDASRPDCAAYLDGPGPDCFTLMQRGRRMTLTGEIAMSGHCEVENPALALPLLQLVLGTLDEEARSEFKFYGRFLAERHPAFFANVPSQQTGRGLAESRPVWFVNGVRGRLDGLTGRAVNRYRGGFADYTTLVRRSHIREQLMQGTLILDEYLGGTVRRALAAGESAGADARLVLAAFTAETYLRQVAGMRSVHPVSQGAVAPPSWCSADAPGAFTPA